MARVCVCVCMYSVKAPLYDAGVPKEGGGAGAIVVLLYVVCILFLRFGCFIFLAVTSTYPVHVKLTAAKCSCH
jgi:hypothetical protein